MFRKGLKDGIPIGLGYFAVAFSLGIAAAQAGLSPFQGFLTSALVNASAGENAAFIAIRESVPYLQMVLISIVSNIRYVLMSFALSQKIDPDSSFIHRILLGFFLTDEYFGLTVNQKPYCDPFYSYGAISFAAPCWAIGTAAGIIAGNSLPARIVSALSVALFGMFLAIIIPPCRSSRPIAFLVGAGFAASYFLSRWTALPESVSMIVLTLALSSLGAIIFPRGEEDA